MFLPMRGEGPEDRHRILVAAAHVLERTGYDGLKVRQVLVRADVSTGAFYRYFASKTDLLLTLLREDAERLFREVEGAMAAEPCPVRKIDAWVDFGVRLAFDRVRYGHLRCYFDPDLAREVPRELADLTEPEIGHLRDVIAAGTASGVFRSGDPDRDARAIHRNRQAYLLEVLRGVLVRDARTAHAELSAYTLQALGVEAQTAPPGDATRRSA